MNIPTMVSTENRVTIDGIVFFDNPSSCISHINNANWATRIIRAIQSYATLSDFCLKFVADKLRSIFHGTISSVEPYIEDKEFLKKRLIVCIHGLGATPYSYEELVDEMQMRDLSETDIYIPHVLEKGRAKLDKAAAPILQRIERWAANNAEDKELVLIGASNGGRIAKAIEVALTGSKICGNIQKLRVVTIVGACNGSSLVNLFKKLGLSSLLRKNIAEEMATDSICNLDLNRKWVDGLNNSRRFESDYTYIASPHDLIVPNFDSTLPAVAPKTGHYALVPGHGHYSIFDRAVKAVAEIILPPKNLSHN